MSDWVKVASTTELNPGQMKAVEVNEEDVLIAHTEDGDFLATTDVCSHEFVLLHGGWLEGAEVECPEHGSKFDMRTGEVLNPPATQPIALYELKVEGEDIFVRGPKETSDE